jgi:hypothetical protein
MLLRERAMMAVVFASSFHGRFDPLAIFGFRLKNDDFFGRATYPTCRIHRFLSIHADQILPLENSFRARPS